MLSSKPTPADIEFRDALLMRLHRCRDLPAETLLLSLRRALQGPAWILQAERVLKERIESALGRWSACLRPEHDREDLEHTLCGAFMTLSEERSERLGERLAVYLALARLPQDVWLLYQRSLPLAVVDEARQTVHLHRMPRPVAIAEPAWRSYCKGWEDEYRRRRTAMGVAMARLRTATELPDAPERVRVRKLSLALSRVAALVRVDQGAPGPTQAGSKTQDGGLADLQVDVAATVRAAAIKLRLADYPAAALAAMSDDELACIVSACDKHALRTYGLHVDEQALASERDRRVTAFAQARLAPCLARLAETPSPAAALPPLPGDIAPDMHDLFDVSARLRDATDIVQACVSLYVACGGSLDGADMTAAFIGKMATLAIPDLCVAPARARVLGRLCVALGDVQANLASSLAEGRAGACLSRDETLRAIAARLVDQSDVPDAMGGAFFTLVRRVAFGTKLAAFVSSAPSSSLAGDDASATRPGEDEASDVLSDPGIRWALQGDFGLDMSGPTPTSDAARDKVFVADAMGRHVENPETGQSIAVREIYGQELSFQGVSVDEHANDVLARAPGRYAVDGSVVDEAYAVDYKRGSCSLSVRGCTPAGVAVSFEAHIQGILAAADEPGPEESKHARVNDVEQALACLARVVDARGFRQITRLLSQFADASISLAETRSGAGTPLRLASGDPVLVGGRAHTHAVVEQNLDDTFDIGMHIEWTHVNAAVLLDSKTGLHAGIVELDPVRSAKSVRYAWRVRPGDDLLIQPVRLADYRYRFVPASPLPDSAINK
ncbi:hypothetical protein [Achromobacter aloeverae]|uniref:hypothetical protein n=1 Tax=Achromobacter aloeverae TaxID=1750518 RepID=UPI00100FF7EE|nr:hypothetical protein [Achromobacter aloeverae]